MNHSWIIFACLICVCFCICRGSWT